MPSPDRNPRVEKKEGACETRGPEAGTRWRRLGTSAKAPEGIYLRREGVSMICINGPTLFLGYTISRSFKMAK